MVQAAGAPGRTANVTGSPVGVGPVELSVCVEAEIAEPDGLLRNLHLSHLYHRFLLEGLTFSVFPKVLFRNL